MKRYAAIVVVSVAVASLLPLTTSDYLVPLVPLAGMGFIFGTCALRDQMGWIPRCSRVLEVYGLEFHTPVEKWRWATRSTATVHSSKRSRGRTTSGRSPRDARLCSRRRRERDTRRSMEEGGTRPPDRRVGSVTDVTPTLQTKRLLLRPYVPEDEDAYVALFQDARVSRWIGDSPTSEPEIRKMFRRIFTEVYARDLFDIWAVRRGGLLIGHAEIKSTDTVSGYEIVYALTPTEWRSGLGTELAEAIVAHGFDTLELTEVFATVATQNRASLALLDRIGFTQVRDIEEDDGSTTRVLSCSPIATNRSSLDR